ncbi:uncharacterized protein JCM6883_000188 [Sporobolomyces salmoneus]|uniref:uncharacterized protein n=1 Tax=Sporobolomyces salmoneus TaxID=183962 RepID=UPI00317991B2
MPSRFILFAILSSLFFSSSFAHYPGPNNHHHEHYARQLATPTYEPLHRRSATPTSGHHSATPTLARRSATPVLSRRDGLQRRYDFESYLKRRQAPSPLPSGMLNRRQAPSPLPSGMLNRRQAPSPMPSATWKRSAEEQSNWDMMYELSRERRSYGETVDEGYYSETNARRIKRGGNPLPPRGFSLQEVGGTLRYLPDQKPSQTVKPDSEETGDAAVVRTGGSFGTGKRCPLKITRKLVDSIHDGSLAKCEFKKSPVFNLSIPTALEGVPSELLDPRQAWSDKDAFDKTNEVQNERSFHTDSRGHTFQA